MAALSFHVMAYLEKAERKEENVWLKEDIRQAWTVCSMAERGMPDPFVQSSYKIYGIHPDDVWPAIMARRRAKLGKEFSAWYDAAGNLKPETPKKPPVREAEKYERLPSLEHVRKVLTILPVPEDKDAA